jgi:hypothetical protein
MTYLAVQAGHIADPAPLAYALKTFVSGGGLPPLFKDVLPHALGLQTLHTWLAREDARARDLPALLATAEGWRLAGHQALTGAVGVAALAAIAWILHRVWTPRPTTAAAAPQALAR